MFSTILVGITLYFLITGALFGLKRGVVRSGARLVLLLLALAIAWYAKESYVSLLLDMDMGGETLRGALLESTADVPSLGSIVVPLVEILLGVILFVTVFLVLNAVTAIIFFVLGFFLPKSNRLLGAFVGLVQGALIAFCICAPMNGILLDMGKIMTIEIDGEPLLGGETVEALEESDIDFEDFADSGISKLYATVGGGFYTELASAKNENGKNVTLTGYADAAVSTIKFADEMTKLGEMDFSEGLTEENRDALKKTFKNLNEIKDDMSEEAMETVNELISSVTADLGAEVPSNVQEILQDLDMSKVDFEKEGDVVIKLYEMTDASSEKEVSATEIVNTLAESTLALTVIESMVTSETPVTLPDAETEDEVRSAIANVQLTNPEAAESLLKIFGWN